MAHLMIVSGDIYPFPPSFFTRVLQILVLAYNAFLSYSCQIFVTSKYTAKV